MSELLTSIGAMISAFFKIFIRGLFKLDNPVMSIIDYGLWGSMIFSIVINRHKRRR